MVSDHARHLTEITATNIEALARNLRCSINVYSANAKPIGWRYSDPACHIRGNAVPATRHQATILNDKGYSRHYLGKYPMG